MKILAIESACERASVALAIADSVLCRELEGHDRHSERLLPVVRGLLDEAGLRLGDLDAVAFGTGPGAFTGLRLACGVAQGLAMGAGLGVVPVCSLAALALDAPAGVVLVATDARMGELYAAVYRHDHGRILEIDGPACMPPEALVVPPGVEHGIGSAFAAYAGRLPPGLADRLISLDVAAVPRAHRVAELAQRGGTDAIIDPALAAPLYVRDKVALTTQERLARGGRV